MGHLSRKEQEEVENREYIYRNFAKWKAGCKLVERLSRRLDHIQVHKIAIDIPLGDQHNLYSSLEGHKMINDKGEKKK